MKNKFKLLKNSLMLDFIHTTQMIDTSLCDDLVDYYHKNGEYKITNNGKGTNCKVSTDVIIWPDSQDKAVQTYINFLSKSFDSFKETYKVFDSPICIAGGTNIQYYEPGEGFPEWHCERSMNQTDQRALVFMTYLNDVTDGGETEWLYQERKIKPKKGLTAIWPTDFTHTHRGIISPTQTKIIITGWFNYMDVLSTQTHYTTSYTKAINEIKKDVNVQKKSWLWN